MKRSFSTLACMELSFAQLLETAVRHGMSGVEIRLDKDQKICGAGTEKAAAIREACETAGVTITDLATGVTIQNYNTALMETAKACADLAAAVGCRAIRVFAGAGVLRFSQIPPQDEDGIVSFLGELCAYAAGIGVDVWLETHGPFSAAKDTRRLIDKTGADNLYALWDFIHTIEYHETPAESVQILGNRLAHVHLKDGVASEDPDSTQYRHTAMGEGEMPVEQVLALLEAADYSGFLSLEWELPWRPELKDCYPDTDATLDAYNRWLDSAESQKTL
ncbi:MAG: sugar phosphate isomerase/epimerase [Clostridia bacterium]|nr:sugar phosphate isomerase/epimerase [Clostridia bacterium]